MIRKALQEFYIKQFEQISWKIKLNNYRSFSLQGIRGGIMGDTLSRDELMRQKLILEILHQVHLPLQNQGLVMLDDRQTITNENLYMRVSFL